mmetsp:Transcript_9825/g.24699  ORF Transcript_9825/g.24699 Transcript_9825/m.24699 type:complete len:176 (-) Transcript_9825:325-852(-)
MLKVVNRSSYDEMQSPASFITPALPFQGTSRRSSACVQRGLPWLPSRPAPRTRLLSMGTEKDDEEAQRLKELLNKEALAREYADIATASEIDDEKNKKMLKERLEMTRKGTEQWNEVKEMLGSLERMTGLAGLLDEKTGEPTYKAALLVGLFFLLPTYLLWQTYVSVQRIPGGGF